MPPGGAPGMRHTEFAAVPLCPLRRDALQVFKCEATGNAASILSFDKRLELALQLKKAATCTDASCQVLSNVASAHIDFLRCEGRGWVVQRGVFCAMGRHTIRSQTHVVTLVRWSMCSQLCAACS